MKFPAVAALLAAGGLLVASVAVERGASPEPAASAAEPSVATAGDVVVHKSPTCGCCGAWEDHLRSAGFTVDSRPTDQMGAVKAELGIPDELSSCHTAVVDGYVVEGHVPADAIARLLRERPDARGLLVPGMPMGSPGMEGPRSDPYDVLLLRHDGTTEVFQHVGG